MLTDVIILIISILLIIGVGIIIGVRGLNRSKDGLTGNYYIRRKVGFAKDDIIVEYRCKNKTLTKTATKEDLEVLRKRFNIEKF